MFNWISGTPLMSLQEATLILPELILTVGLLLLLVMTVLTDRKSHQDSTSLMYTAFFFVLSAFIALIANFRQVLPLSPQVIFSGSLTLDLMSYLFRFMILTGAGMSILIANRFLIQRTRIVGDYYILIMGATLGALLLSMATDLLTVFVGLETLSITSYILAGYLRKTPDSAEASFKYLVYGGVGTGIFLFGLSLVYGIVGGTGFQAIASTLAQYQGIAHPTLILLMVMIFSALAFKLTVAPFHMWAPDVYEGSPTPTAAFLSVVSKAAAFAVTLRILFVLFPGFAQWQAFWMVLAILSMTIGNFVALKQRNVKRLLAYSTVAHVGYMLLGLVVQSSTGVGSMVYYMLTYVFMNLGAFACAIYFESLTNTNAVEAYSGLVKKRPGLALGMTICLLSLTGIPFTSGFFAKFFLFQSVILSNPSYLWVVVVALLNSTVSLAYYINVIRLMVVKDPSPEVQAIPELETRSLSLTTSIAFCVAMTLLMGIFASPFIDFTRVAAQQLMQEKAVVVSQVQGSLQ